MDSEDQPRGPTDLPRRAWFGVLRRTAKEFSDDNLTDWAAGLTYYGVLSLFPALVVLVSLLGVFGQSAQPLVDSATRLAPGEVRQIILDAVSGLQAGQGRAGLVALIGLAGALWAASGYVGAFIRATNAIYEVREDRPLWKAIPVRLGLTVVTGVLAAATAFAVVLTGPLAEWVGGLVGLGDAAVTVWDIAKWPVLVAVVMLILAILYWAAPNVRHGGFRWITPGAVVAVVLWIIASAGFGVYVANFGSYNKTYGVLAGVIVFLVWLWITNIVVLFGAELDAELERERDRLSGG